MKLATIPVVASALLSGCSSRILVDQVHGRMSAPCSRVADLGMDRPGSLLAGGHVAIRKPSDVEWKEPTADTLVAGRQSWRLPGWSAGGHLAWTPFEGLTLVPEGHLSGRGGDLQGDGSATMGMHAEAGGVAWQVEGRTGISWARSTTTWRTLVEDIHAGDTTHLDSIQSSNRAGLVPWVQIGLQVQSAIPRQDVQLWTLGRWGVRDPSLLWDEKNGEVLPKWLMEWQFGAGLHRRLGKRGVLTFGVLREIMAPPGMNTADATTEILLQFDLALSSRD